ncbi:MAG: LysM peptidoglycan-binding domain-containing protein [Desulfobacteraceae bacterium]
MKISKTLLVIMVIFLTAGCKYSGNFAVPSSSSQTGTETAESETAVSESSTDDPSLSNKNPGPDLQKADTSKKSAEKKGFAPVQNHTDSPLALQETSSDVTPPPPDKTSARQTIDKALLLYKHAQKMWEKGDLEEAMSDLDKAYSKIVNIDLDQTPDLNQEKEDLRYMISKRVLEIYASRHIVVNGKHNAIPMTMNKYVEREIERLTGPNRPFLIQSLKRAARYRPFILPKLKEAGLPEELSWLPLVESGFKIRALSSARALGLWQFIPSTGHKFGLKRNYYIDERLDPEKSTEAAIDYLKELHKIFGDWSTVLAAYNCGEGRVLHIIKKQKINYLDNFWDLYQKLPSETARYVPKFLATLHIINNMDKYDINVDESLKPLEYETFAVNKQIRLSSIAKEIDVSTDVLTTLNPELRYALLPPEEYQLRIPASHSEIFAAKLDKIKSSYPPPEKFAYHRVKRGQTLSGIARRYHSSVNSITRANSLRRSNMIVAGQVLKIPKKGNHSAGGADDGTYSGKKIKYTVKQGDNLWNIARRYDTTTKKIKMASGIRSNDLHINQTLQIPVDPDRKTGTGTSSYWVKSGDSPFTIARKHQMSLKRLLTLNDLNKQSKIYPGQKLLVE